MKHLKSLIALSLTVAVGQAARADDAATKPATQGSHLHDASYGVGYQVLADIARNSRMKFDNDALLTGLRDALEGKPSRIPEEQVNNAMQQMVREMQNRAGVENAAAGDEQAKKGEAYRAENAKKEGVKVMPSGLQIQMTKEGEGATPAATDRVKVHYTGTLIDGTKFDSSVDRGQPAVFPVNRVIAGWTEALQLMKVGGKARLVIPPEIGYGPQGAPPTIPPNATLVFEVELLEVIGK